jgi:hypothetical protein
VFPPPRDPRLLRADGLCNVGEVTAVDLLRFAAQGNHRVIHSSRNPGTIYVVFRAAPSIQEIIHRRYTRAGFGTVAGRARTAERLMVRGSTRKQQLKSDTYAAIMQAEWTASHPASIRVGSIEAHTYVNALEFHGEALIRFLRDLRILSRTADDPVNLEAYQQHIGAYEAVIIGMRAVHPYAPVPQSHCILCTCKRFALRPETSCIICCSTDFGWLGSEDRSIG